MMLRKATPFRRGMGQAAYTSGPCQYQVAGITPDPGIPFCGPGGYQMTPAQIASVQASQKAGGYTDVSTGAFSPGGNPNCPMAGGGGVALQPVSQFVAVQSNAPATSVVGSPGTPAQSNAANTSYATPVTSTPVGCFSLFAGEPCAGPVGLYTLLAGAAAAIAAMSLFGGHR